MFTFSIVNAQDAAPPQPVNPNAPEISFDKTETTVAETKPVEEPKKEKAKKNKSKKK
ncbi:MAG: hypothetical protein WCI04_03555 [archaeon]